MMSIVSHHHVCRNKIRADESASKLQDVLECHNRAVAYDRQCNTFSLLFIMYALGAGPARSFFKVNVGPEPPCSDPAVLTHL